MRDRRSEAGNADCYNSVAFDVCKYRRALGRADEWETRDKYLQRSDNLLLWVVKLIGVTIADEADELLLMNWVRMHLYADIC